MSLLLITNNTEEELKLRQTSNPFCISLCMRQCGEDTNPKREPTFAVLRRKQAEENILVNRDGANLVRPTRRGGASITRRASVASRYTTLIPSSPLPPLARFF